MTPFFLLALAMSGAVLWLLLRPLLKTPPTTDMNNDLNPLREQIRQLDALRDSGTLDAEAHALARARVERQLVDQVLQQTPPAPARAAARPVARWPPAWRWACSPSWAPGTPGSAARAAPGRRPPTVAALPTETAPHPMAPGDMRAMVDTLATRLAQNPDDADGWVMLARSYAVLGEHAQARAGVPPGAGGASGRRRCCWPTWPTRWRSATAAASRVSRCSWCSAHW